jgi:hypothetical protein
MTAMGAHLTYDEFIENCRDKRRSLVHGMTALAADDLVPMQAPYGDMSTQLLQGMHEQLRLLDRCIAAYDRHLH